MAGALLYLADSNILLRLTKRDHPQYSLVRGAVHALRQRGMSPTETAGPSTTLRSGRDNKGEGGASIECC
jgi:hypothetical protein